MHLGERGTGQDPLARGADVGAQHVEVGPRPRVHLGRIEVGAQHLPHAHSVALGAAPVGVGGVGGVRRRAGRRRTRRTRRWRRSAPSRTLGTQRVAAARGRRRPRSASESNQRFVAQVAACSAAASTWRRAATRAVRSPELVGGAKAVPGRAGTQRAAGRRCSPTPARRRATSGRTCRAVCSAVRRWRGWRAAIRRSRATMSDVEKRSMMKSRASRSASSVQRKRLQPRRVRGGCGRRVRRTPRASNR